MTQGKSSGLSCAVAQPTATATTKMHATNADPNRISINNAKKEVGFDLGTLNGEGQPVTDPKGASQGDGSQEL